MHFDAHPDTIDNIDGHRINPATPFRRSVEEGITDPKRHVMIGIRGTTYETEPFDWAEAQGMTILTVDDVEEMGAKGVVVKIRELMGDAPVYVTYDLDGTRPPRREPTAPSRAVSACVTARPSYAVYAVSILSVAM